MKKIIFMASLLMSTQAFAVNWHTTAVSYDNKEAAYLDTDSVEIYNLFSLKPINEDFDKNIYVKYSQKIQTPEFSQIKEVFASCKYWTYGPTYVQVFDKEGRFVADKTPQFVTTDIPTDSFDGITANHACILAARKDFDVEENNDTAENIALLKYRFPNHYKTAID